ncbi:hypothetical protein lerEdw1_007476 [Lerista edwardsae]|nr:hypothetical protein lerEdw1_007476 [Lerista edwardsae]
MAKELLKTLSSSLVLPSVDCRAVSHLSAYFQKNLYKNFLNVEDPDMLQQMGNASEPHVFVINLQPVTRINELSTRKALLENDKIIGRFAKALQQLGGQSLAIYTARQPSGVPVELAATWYSRRQLMAVENKKNNDSYPPLKIYNGTQTCILFYATNFSLLLNQSIPINLTNRTFVSPNVNTASSDCQNTTNAILSLKYENPEDRIKVLEIRFIMSNKFYAGSARNWFTLDHIWILQDDRDIAKFNVSKISSPAEYSFHCQLVGTSSLYGATLIPDSDEAKKWEMVILEFQIQAFSAGNGTFSYASDCTTFFTPAIWMALVSSLILLWILTYGIHMVVHLTTNGRFDDPKDAALSVPQTE